MHEVKKYILIGYNFYRLINNFDFFPWRFPVKLLNEQNETFKTEIG